MDSSRTALVNLKHVPPAAMAELQLVYARLGEALEPFRRHCEMRGICCNFATAGHMLYVTSLEAAPMLAAGETPDYHQSAEGKCPFMRGKQCGIRDHRALGCRMYYCDDTYKQDRNDTYERFMKQIREIEKRYGIEHSYDPVTQLRFEE